MSARRTAPAATAPVRKLRIVAVDDSVADLEALARHLAGIPGWDVTLETASDLDAARPIFAGGGLDLALLDAVAARNASDAVCGELANLCRDVPIILTARSNDGDIVSLVRQLGAADCLQKNALSPRSLERSIGNAIDKHGLMSQAMLSNLKVADLEHRLGDALHAISQELSQPTGVALNLVSLLLDGGAGPLASDQRAFLQRAAADLRRASTRLTELVEELCREDRGA